MFKILSALAASAIAIIVIVFGAVAPPAAQAHRPPLDLAQKAAKNAARYQCFWVLFPTDPQEERCRSYGAEADPVGRDRHVGEGHGHSGGSWAFPRAWVTNNSYRVIRFRLRVSYVCAANPSDGLPCVEYRVWISNIRPLEARLAARPFSDAGVQVLGR